MSVLQENSISGDRIPEWVRQLKEGVGANGWWAEFVARAAKRVVESGH
jgi:hypothetical protein